jgi:membrane-associated HD superfamily phosphohydrolase
LTLTIEKAKDRTISQGGNSSVLYLPKKYFTPGETVSSHLEIDADGNLKMTLTKKLFNFTCDSIKKLVSDDFKVEIDKKIADNTIFSAVKGNLSLNCIKTKQDLEPTYVTVTRRYDEMQSPKNYNDLTKIVKTLTEQKFDAYLEAEGNLDSINVYKNPQRYSLKNESEAVEALLNTGKKIGFSLIIRFDSKKNSEQQIKTALNQLVA